MKRVTSLIVLSGAAALVACASQAPAPPTAAAGQGTALAAGQGGASATAQDTAFKAPPGYRRKVVSGKEMYCREDAVMGSRVEKHEVCLTQQQLASGDTGEDAYEKLQNGQGAPAGGGNPVGNTETGGR